MISWLTDSYMLLIFSLTAYLFTNIVNININNLFYKLRLQNSFYFAYASRNE